MRDFAGLKNITGDFPVITHGCRLSAVNNYGLQSIKSELFLMWLDTCKELSRRGVRSFDESGKHMLFQEVELFQPRRKPI